MPTAATALQGWVQLASTAVQPADGIVAPQASSAAGCSSNRRQAANKHTPDHRGCAGGPAKGAAGRSGGAAGRCEGRSAATCRRARLIPVVGWPPLAAATAALEAAPAVLLPCIVH